MANDGEQQTPDVNRKQSVRSMSRTMAILLLSLSAPVSAVSYSLLQLLPGETGLMADVLYWSLLSIFFLTGILGFLGFVPAVVLTVIASASRYVSVRRKLAMWICVAVSLVALIYLSQYVQS